MMALHRRPVIRSIFIVGAEASPTHLGTGDPQGMPVGLEHALHQDYVPHPAPVGETTIVSTVMTAGSWLCVGTVQAQALLDA